MTLWLTGVEVADRIRARFPDAVADANAVWVEVAAERLVEVCEFLRDDPDLAMEQATNVTSVDWLEYFEVVYHLQSITRNQIMTLKCRPPEREAPSVPSVAAVWQGAWLQEMEVYDLMGIRFEGHPNLRRLFLWEGFSGWPLRKDFLQVDRGGFSPGLPHFPKEGGEVGRLDGPVWANQDAATPRGRLTGTAAGGWGSFDAPPADAGEAFKR
jgi:NADH-quinone oxidoreductase subunit C